MNKKLNFSDWLLFDGAMGTMLQNHGIKFGELPESYNILYPELIEKIHKEYIDAGCDIITTNTFGANSYKLKNYSYSVKEIITSAVRLARKAAKDRFVALDIGPIGQLMQPYGTLTFQEAYDIFAEQVKIGFTEGADVILIETMSDIYEAKAAILAAKENSPLPVFCTMTLQNDGRTLTGTDPLTMVTVLQGLGVDALGINCSLGPKEIIPQLNDILLYSKVPIMVQPNAGLPEIKDSTTIYNVTPYEFASDIKSIAELGATILGGCCGTTPEFISEVRKALDSIRPVSRHVKKITAAASGVKTEIIGEGITIIGERINPTGKKKIKDALKSGNINYLALEAIQQKDAGANIIDINAGIPEIDEEEMMVKITKEIQSLIQLPLQIDSMQPKVIEAAVRIYNGKPIINSVNGKKESMDAIFPIAKKYGALVIGLTLDEKGIPFKAEDRLDVAKKIVDCGESYGIAREDIIIDTLALTASAQQDAVKETIKAIGLIKEELGVKTTLGVSNVSYGLPRRELLNSTFLAMALTAGLDAPIIDPLDEGIKNTISSFNVLWSYDVKAEAYIKSLNDKPTPSWNLDNNIEKSLKQIIITGLKGDVEKKTRELLLNNIKAMEIIDDHLIPALEHVGEEYERGNIFLPQLIQSAEAVNKAFEVIKENLSSGELERKSNKILLATVKGDIHDIGKNIVKVLLENYGFDVIDLGKDVASEDILAMVQKENIKLIGLSALMTTTVKSMEETITALKKYDKECMIMVGGAVLNQDYSKLIGADYYAKDARSGVKIARSFFNM
ncbi:homocysteine S-methyltransferase family protein [Alkaliphilus peptidifermentans]|uniref:Methionine synthase n=1 Tax=Alkaliphilus peptidifermentans DSM 18978 TaxID=1120976 RepID=A0A1G5KF21_9FIRM|nr:homocysteine S-methyltransferase family protein [Alkaliphilus peptidifermentans]SCY99187.1 5-methyltetrahydrofolate--homocysteine methyltransferase [Alkaliphilus peptidifermentans DSM 18978]